MPLSAVRRCQHDCRPCQAGYPPKGLIGHFQGSGKSLLMVFAAQKLRMCKDLKNPTVVILEDRIDLKDQITATFNASDIPNLYSALSKQDLIDFFKQDIRKIMITTIFKFGEFDGVLNERDNIIVMVDEAHRTQEVNLGEKMRQSFLNAFFRTYGYSYKPCGQKYLPYVWGY